MLSKTQFPKKFFRGQCRYTDKIFAGLAVENTEEANKICSNDE